MVQQSPVRTLLQESGLGGGDGEEAVSAWQGMCSPSPRGKMLGSTPAIAACCVSIQHSLLSFSVPQIL